MKNNFKKNDSIQNIIVRSITIWSVCSAGAVLALVVLSLFWIRSHYADAAKNPASTRAQYQALTSEVLRTGFEGLDQSKVFVVDRSDLRELEPSIDRTAYLSHLFREVTRDETTTRARALKWVSFLQQRLFHAPAAPVDDQGTAVFDPIWLLKNRAAHCGQAARLVVDGLEASGYKARLVQLSGHVVAEAYWDGGWHMLDADIPTFGEHVFTSDGRVPSVFEIAANPQILDRLELKSENPKKRSPQWSSRLRHIYKATFKTRFYKHIGLSTPFIWTKRPGNEGGIYNGWGSAIAKPPAPNTRIE